MVYTNNLPNSFGEKKECLFEAIKNLKIQFNIAGLDRIDEIGLNSKDYHSILDILEVAKDVDTVNMVGIKIKEIKSAKE